MLKRVVAAAKHHHRYTFVNEALFQVHTKPESKQTKGNCVRDQKTSA
jgi:hypothetical protein